MDGEDRRLADNPERLRRIHGDIIGVIALCVFSLFVVGGLYLIARDKPSAASNSPDVLQTPAVTSNDACQNFADYWMTESGVDVDASVVEGLTNCWQAADGRWFIPTGPTDPRLPADYALTESERTETAALRQELVSEIQALEETISASVQRDLDSIYDPRVRPIVGHVKDGVSISRPRSRYTRVVQAYLIAPEHTVLADYVGWLMSSKIAAYDTLRSTCEANDDVHYLVTACRGLEDSLSVQYPPWTWDLRSSVSIEGYLAYLARTDNVSTGQQARGRDTAADAQS